MALYGLDQIRNAIGLIPELALTDVKEAVSKANKVLPKRRMVELHDQLQAAFRDYFVNHLFSNAIANERPSETKRKLGQIASTSEKLIRLLGIKKDSQGAGALYLSMVRSAEKEGARLNGFDSHPKIVLGGADDVRLNLEPVTDFRGREKLLAIAKDLQLLTDIAVGAQKIQTAKSNKTSSRNPGDPDMRQLIGNLNGIWIDIFEEAPGAGYDELRQIADGPYIRFLESLFSQLTSRIPTELSRVNPNLKRSLSLTPNAIRTKVQKTNIGRLRIKRKSQK